MTAPTSAQFLLDFPEFNIPNRFPPSAVTFWLKVAGLVLTSRWDDTDNGSGVTMLSLGTELFVAHNLVMVKESLDRSARGGNPGTDVGILDSKTVGPISVKYDNSLATDLAAGHWASTTYGQRFVELAGFLGSYPIQLGVGCSYTPFMTPIPSGGAWFGPMVDQGWGW